jgi:hypothetical protein
MYDNLIGDLSILVISNNARARTRQHAVQNRRNKKLRPIELVWNPECTQGNKRKYDLSPP